jgi:DNA-binding transcriptional ArsR family regulator
MTDIDQLTRTFAALADPTRRAILERLARGDATVAELREPFAISAPAISRHLRVLEASGLITQQRRGSWRVTAIRAEPLEEVTAYLERYRTDLDAGFERLRDHLRQRNDETDNVEEREQ